MQHLLRLLICLTALVNTSQFDWCSVQCEYSGKVFKHTMCLYSVKPSQGKCKQIRNMTNPDFRGEMLRLHNQFRDNFAKGEMKDWSNGSNIQQITWDYTLEEMAALWGMQCSRNFHDSCRLTPEFSIVSQSSGYAVSSKEFPSVTGITSLWMDEVEATKAPEYKRVASNEEVTIVREIRLFTEQDTYKTMIYAGTYKIGCGETRGILNPDQIDGKYITILVCNYALGAGPNQKLAYEIGDPCTACSDGTRCRNESAYPHLCARPEDPLFDKDIPDLYTTLRTTPANATVQTQKTHVSACTSMKTSTESNTNRTPGIRGKDWPFEELENTESHILIHGPQDLLKRRSCAVKNEKAFALPTTLPLLALALKYHS